MKNCLKMMRSRRHRATVADKNRVARKSPKNADKSYVARRKPCGA